MFYPRKTFFQNSLIGFAAYSHAERPAHFSLSFILKHSNPHGGFIKGILRGVRCTKSLRVLFLHRRPPSWTTLVLYSRAVFIFNEPAFRVTIDIHGGPQHIGGLHIATRAVLDIIAIVCFLQSWA
jgi:hypothetical protein